MKMQNNLVLTKVLMISKIYSISLQSNINSLYLCASNGSLVMDSQAVDFIFFIPTMSMVTWGNFIGSAQLKMVICLLACVFQAWAWCSWRYMHNPADYCAQYPVIIWFLRGSSRYQLCLGALQPQTNTPPLSTSQCTLVLLTQLRLEIRAKLTSLLFDSIRMEER